MKCQPEVSKISRKGPVDTKNALETGNANDNLLADRYFIRESPLVLTPCL